MHVSGHKYCPPETMLQSHTCETFNLINDQQNEKLRRRRRKNVFHVVVCFYWMRQFIVCYIFLRQLNDFSISLKLLPSVSGKWKYVNSTPNKLFTANMKNVCCVPMKSRMYGNIFTVPNIKRYAIEMTKPPSFPLTSVGKSSPINVHGITRTPNELLQTYPSTQTKRIVSLVLFSSKNMEMAAVSEHSVIPRPKRIYELFWHERTNHTSFLLLTNLMQAKISVDLHVGKSCKTWKLF